MLACPKCGSSYLRDVVFCGLDGERLVETQHDPLLGRRVDRYELLEIIGDGGMARVYRARHVHLDQHVAVKILYGDMATDRALSERFRREAQSSAQIKHPNVVSVLDFGISAEGLSFLAMELLEGQTLADVIKAQKRVAPPRAAEITRQIALGLSAAHQQGFVHRDLKPKNVMFSRDSSGAEKIKILDFGLVRPLEENDERLTARGQVFGTPAYMAPEQITDGEIDARTDLYALGAIIYELISGKPPFTGQMTEVFRKHLSQTPAPLDERTGLGELAMLMLSKSQNARPESAMRVVELIDQLGLTQMSMPVTPPPVRMPAPRPTPLPAKNTSEKPARRGPPDPLGVELFDSIELNEAHLRSIAQRARPRWTMPIVILCGLIAAAAGYGWWISQQESVPHSVPAVEGVQTPAEPAVKPKPPVVEKPAVPEKPTNPVVAETSDAGLTVVDAAVASVAEKPPVVSEKPPVVLEKPAVPAEKPQVPEEEPEVVDPDEPELPAAAVPPFDQLDKGILWALAQRRIVLRDLSVSEVDTWLGWRNTAEKEPPDPKLLIKTYETLHTAIDKLVIDAALIKKKINRVRAMLDRVPEADRTAEKYQTIKARLDTIAEEAATAGAEDWDGLAVQLTLLESDAEAL